MASGTGADGPGSRELTPAEARVIHSLLAAEPVNVTDRIRRSGLPPRTYEVARERLVRAGCVFERNVPDPTVWGLRGIRFALAEPPAAERADLVTRWSGRPETILLWHGAGGVFGVFAATSLPDLSPPARAGDRPPWSWSLTVDLERPSVPVFFDFEGAWARVVGAAPIAYPRCIPSADAQALHRAARSKAVREAGERQVRSTLGPEARSSPAGPISPVRWLRTGERDPTRGIIARRAYLDLRSLPGYRGWQLAAVRFVRGRLRPGHGAPELYQRLLVECGMTPFLFATDDREVLLGALAPPPLRSTPDARTPAARVLSEGLADLRQYTIAVEDLQVPVDYRFDRLVSRGAPAIAPEA